MRNTDFPLPLVARFRPVLTALASLAVAASVSAAPPEAADPAKVLAPFLDEQVAAVVRVDMSRIDLQAAETWLADNLRAGAPEANPARAKALKGVVQELPKLRAPIGKAIADFQAAGGRDVFLLIRPAEIANRNTPLAVLIPVANPADAEKLLAVTASPLGAKAAEPMSERVGDVIVFGPKEIRDTLRAIHGDASKQAANPDLMAALATGGPDDAVRIAVAPSADLRRAFGELAPNLPPALGGGSSGDLVRALKWASVGLKLPPQPSVGGVLQSPDASQAELLERYWKRAVAAAGEAKNAPPAAQTKPGEDALWAAVMGLVPSVQAQRDGDKIQLALDEAGLAKLAQVLGGALVEARGSAMSVQSMNNTRQLVLACVIWSNTHKGEWPDNLADAIQAAKLPAQVAVNPAHPETGYTYVKPPGKANDPATRVVVYEDKAGPRGRAVGFMDGHSEWLKEEALQAALVAQRGEAPKSE